MRTITTHQLKEAARHHFNENRLMFQAPNPSCIYEDEEGRHCVIGAVLNSEEFEQIGDLGLTVQQLIKTNVLRFESPKFASKLQDAHDQIVRAKIMKDPEHKINSSIDYFKKMVGLEV